MWRQKNVGGANSNGCPSSGQLAFPIPPNKLLQLATFFKLVAITTIIAKSRLDRGRFVSVAVCCILKMIAYAVGLAPALLEILAVADRLAVVFARAGCFLGLVSCTAVMFKDVKSSIVQVVMECILSTLLEPMRLKTHVACAVLGEVVNVWYFKYLQTMPVPGSSLNPVAHASVRLLFRVTMAAWQVYLLNRPGNTASRSSSVSNKQEQVQEPETKGGAAGSSSGVKVKPGQTQKVVELDDVFSGESEVQRHLQPLLQSSSHYASGAGLRLRGGAAGGDESQPQEEQGDSLQQQLCQTVIPGHPVGSAAPQVPGSKEVGTEPSSPALRDQAWAAGGLLSEGATDSAGGVVSSSYCSYVQGGELGSMFEAYPTDLHLFPWISSAPASLPLLPINAIMPQQQRHSSSSGASPRVSTSTGQQSALGHTLSGHSLAPTTSAHSMAATLSGQGLVPVLEEEIDHVPASLGRKSSPTPALSPVTSSTAPAVAPASEGISGRATTETVPVLPEMQHGSSQHVLYSGDTDADQQHGFTTQAFVPLSHVIPPESPELVSSSGASLAAPALSEEVTRVPRPYRRVLRHAAVKIKVPHLEPEEVAVEDLRRVAAALSPSWLLSGVVMRRGCTELELSLVSLDPATTAVCQSSLEECDAASLTSTLLGGVSAASLCSSLLAALPTGGVPHNARVMMHIETEVALEQERGDVCAATDGDADVRAAGVDGVSTHAPATPDTVLAPALYEVTCVYDASRGAWREEGALQLLPDERESLQPAGAQEAPMSASCDVQQHYAGSTTAGPQAVTAPPRVSVSVASMQVAPCAAILHTWEGSQQLQLQLDILLCVDQPSASIASQDASGYEAAAPRVMLHASCAGHHVPLYNQHWQLVEQAEGGKAQLWNILVHAQLPAIHASALTGELLQLQLLPYEQAADEGGLPAPAAPALAVDGSLSASSSHHTPLRPVLGRAALLLLDTSRGSLAEELCALVGPCGSDTVTLPFLTDLSLLMRSAAAAASATACAVVQAAPVAGITPNAEDPISALSAAMHAQLTGLTQQVWARARTPGTPAHQLVVRAATGLLEFAAAYRVPALAAEVAQCLEVAAGVSAADVWPPGPASGLPHTPSANTPHEAWGRESSPADGPAHVQLSTAATSVPLERIGSPMMDGAGGKDQLGGCSLLSPWFQGAEIVASVACRSLSTGAANMEALIASVAGPAAPAAITRGATASALPSSAAPSLHRRASMLTHMAAAEVGPEGSKSGAGQHRLSIPASAGSATAPTASPSPLRQAVMAAMLGGWQPVKGSGSQEAAFRVWLAEQLRVVATCWAVVRLGMAGVHLGRRYLATGEVGPVLAALIFSSPHILWLTHITGWTRYLPGSLTHGWRLDCEKGSQRAVGTYFNAALLTNIISMAIAAAVAEYQFAVRMSARSGVDCMIVAISGVTQTVLTKHTSRVLRVAGMLVHIVMYMAQGVPHAVLRALLMHSLAMAISFGAEVAWRLKWAHAQEAANCTTAVATKVKKDL